MTHTLVNVSFLVIKNQQEIFHENVEIQSGPPFRVLCWAWAPLKRVETLSTHVRKQP